MRLFDGKKGLILGVANDRSIAWAIAEEILARRRVRLHSSARQARRRQAEEPAPRAKVPRRRWLGADEVPRPAQRAKRRAHRRGDAAGQGRVRAVDFLLHSIAYADLRDLQTTPSDQPRGVQLAMDISAYSLIAVCNAAKEFSARDLRC
jgi:enoyl-[acyl-carrier protein] reductase I